MNSKSALKPVGDKILIEMVRPEKESGIVLPEGFSLGEEIAKVMAIGTDKDIVVRPGDEVIFNPASALSVEIRGEKYVLVTQKGIIAIMNYDRDGRDVSS